MIKRSSLALIKQRRVTDFVALASVSALVVSLVSLAIVTAMMSLNKRTAYACPPLYAQYSQSTIGNISYSYQATPPGTRVDCQIGIGEKVVCSWNPASWNDYDKKWNYEYSYYEIVEDETFDHTWWYVSGDATLSGNSGNATTATATKISSNGSATVWLQVFDNTDMYQDASADESVAFTILVPSGVNFTYHSNNTPWAPWSSGPRFLGASATFIGQVTPLSVSFKDINIRENYGSGTQGNWPNIGNPPNFAQWTSLTGFRPNADGVPLSPTNRFGDTQSFDRTREDALDNTPPYTDYSGYTDFSWGFYVPLEFQYDGGWSQFATPYASRFNKASDITSKVKVGNSDWNPVQGPWQSP